MNVDDLIARQEIIERLNRYAELLDTGRPREVPAEVFTEDIVENHGEGLPVHDGPEALADFLEKAIEPFAGCVHMNTNYDIDVQGDSATSRCYYLALHWLKKEGVELEAADWISVGMYRDEWVRTAAGWRIRRRRRENIGPSSVAVGARATHLLEMAGRLPPGNGSDRGQDGIPSDR